MNRRQEKYIFFTRVIFFILIGLITLNVSGQKKVKMTAKGSYVSLDLTPNQIREKALIAAKQDALNKAGVAESIAVSDFLYTFEDNEKFQEIFQAFTSTETGGEVIVDKISENRSVNEFNALVIEVEIEATVFVHDEKEDPALNIKIEGIEDNYKNGGKLHFTVTPGTDGYLKIFNVTEDYNALLYPYRDEELTYLNDDPDFRLKAMQKVVFPIHKAYDNGYSLEITSSSRNKEFNLLIFVFTRENIAFLEDDTDVNKIMEWIYSIPMDKRKVVQKGFVITR